MDTCKKKKKGEGSGRERGGGGGEDPYRYITEIFINHSKSRIPCYSESELSAYILVLLHHLPGGESLTVLHDYIIT